MAQSPATSKTLGCKLRATRRPKVVEVGADGVERPLLFADLPPNAATLLTEGPLGTALIGSADGSWGLWELGSGDRLLGGRLHGAVISATPAGPTLTLLSELDHREAVDLTPFFVPLDELRERIDTLR
ncbi:MAG: hypothetical protein ABIO70_36885 [Pseudomonadota bacterium]